MGLIGIPEGVLRSTNQDYTSGDSFREPTYETAHESVARTLTVTGAASGNLYTVPDGFNYFIESIFMIAHASGGAPAGATTLNVISGGVAVQQLGRIQATTNLTILSHFLGRIIAPPGSTITLATGTDIECSAGVSGFIEEE